jgi:lipopolysaccharide biosynthesis glycosyltransferase
MNTFCTIITSQYLPFAKALYNSLAKLDSNVSLQVLIVNDANKLPSDSGIHFHSLYSILTSSAAEKAYDKYSGINNDQLRWAFKPIFLNHLLKNNFDKIIYVDPDVFFVNDFSFLWDELDNHNMILTPHWSEPDPFVDEDNFLMSFRIGLFNAGFVGVNKKGKKALLWWLNACLYSITKDETNGLYDDQRYLDMIPVLFEETGIIRHKGCNLGSWNIHTNKRIVIYDHVLINGEYPVIFIHFNHETIRKILNGNDEALKKYFDEYESSFDNYPLKKYISELEKWKKTNLFMQLKRKTKFRTRLKKWLFKLSKEI